MPKFNGHRDNINPVAGVANFVLESASTTLGRIMDTGWGGEATTSTGMRTRISRDSAVGTGARTAGNVQKTNATTATPGNGMFFSSTYATTQPTIVAGALFGTSWNAHGGVIRFLCAPDEAFALAGAASIECRQDAGTATSGYWVIWEED